MPDHGRLLLGAFGNADAAVGFANRLAIAAAAQVRTQWPRARQAFVAHRNGQPAPSVGALSSETLLLLTNQADAPLFRASVDGRHWRFATVSLAALITTQPLVNLARLEVMRQHLRNGLLPLLFPAFSALEVKAEATDGPTVALIANRGDLIVSAAEVRQSSESGPIEILFRVEPKPNYATVLHCEDRLIVRNGNHRLVVAWQAGLRSVPCVLIEGDMHEFADQRWDRFPVESLRSDHPPRLKDLAAPGGACLEVALRLRQFVTRVRAEQSTKYED